MDQDNEEYRDYPVAYFPISKRVVKQEPTSEEDDEECISEKDDEECISEEQVMPHPLAYPPLPKRFIIKNELQSEEDHGDINFESQVISQQEESQNPFNQETGVIGNPPLADHSENGTERRQARKQKRAAVNNIAVTVGSGDIGRSLAGEILPEEQTLAPLIAYPPVSIRFVKEESTFEDGNGGKDQRVLIAYPPVPKRIIKNEMQSREDRDENNPEVQERTPMNPINEAADGDAPIAGPSADSSSPGLDDLEGSQFFGGMQTLPSTSRGFRTQQSNRSRSLSAGNVESSERRNETEELALEEDMEDGDEQTMEQENDDQHRVENLMVAYPPISIAFIKEEPKDDGDGRAEESQIIKSTSGPTHQRATGSEDLERCQSTETSSTDRSKSTVTNGKTTGRQIVTEKLTKKKRSRGNEHQNAKSSAAAGEFSKHSSLEDMDSTSDDLSDGGGKEKPPSGNYQVAFNSGIQQEGHPNPTNKDTDAMNVNSSTTDHHGHGTEKGQARKRKRAAAVKNFTETVGFADVGGSQSADMTVPSTSRILRSRSKRSNTRITESSGEMSRDLVPEVNSAEVTDELDADYSKAKEGASEHSSLEDMESSEDIDFTVVAGTSKRKHRQSKDTPSSPEKVNEGKKSFPFKCVRCENSYKYKKNLQRHVVNMCGKDPSFFCSQCDYQTKWKVDLKKHMINVHKADQSQLAASGAGPNDQRPSPFKCEKCGRFFKNKETLQAHFSYSKCLNKEPSFSCPRCDYQTVWKKNFQEHLINSHGVKRSQLAAFGAGPTVRPELPFKCTRCDRTYRTKGTLRHHMLKECGVDPSYLCTLCDHRFRKKEKLKYHLINVHGVVDPSQLAAHGAGYSFQCGFCPFRGNQEASLKKHIAKEHNGS